MSLDASFGHFLCQIRAMSGTWACVVHTFVSCHLQLGLPRAEGWPRSLLRWQLVPPILTSHGIGPAIQNPQKKKKSSHPEYIFWGQLASRRWSAMSDAHSSTRHISISQCNTVQRTCTTKSDDSLLTWFLGCRPSTTKVKARTAFLWLPSTHTLPLLSRRHNHPSILQTSESDGLC